MVGKAQLRVLGAVSDEQSLTALHEQTGYSMSRIHEVVEGLEADGLVVTRHGDRNRRLVSPVETTVYTTYRRLQVQHPHIDFPALLSHRTLHVCWFLDQPRTVREITDRLPITRQRVYQLLKPLRERAIITKDGPRFEIADDLGELVAFAHAVVEHEHQQRARTLASSATVLWCTPAEALVAVETEDDRERLVETNRWIVTGLARFAGYGLQFFSANQPPLFYSELDTELSVEQLVCHTLRTGTDQRRTSYALLLVVSAGYDEDRLRTIAADYDLESIVEEMLSFLQSEAVDSRYIPTERDFEMLKQQYEVTA
ncbi:MarR family transcriptional regulator [Haladaptatus caseinilyticus]|uniref:MarR family transcriptional regulator n=1 Tax=Haladaptatus caseinilyticus TaxID=2993314 RepID=UPI00224B2708|nr:helix-turn-helix domain-containing protein [Haladaptatus caseinilyticus]